MVSPKAPHGGHRKRIKEKYSRSGIGGWLDYEVVELLLSYAIPRKDTKPAAKELLAKFGSIAGILDARPEELRSVKGISHHTALLLRLVKDTAKLYIENDVAEKELISSPGAVVNYLKALIKGCPDEEFHALFLNTANRLIAAEKVHSGTVNKSAVFPRKIAELALRHRASGVIVAHNHPAGTLKPSGDDMAATAAVSAALNAIDVMLLDHIIIGGNGHFSWKEHALL